MYRSLATHLVVLALGIGVGLGGVAVAAKGQNEAHSAASDSQILQQLKYINQSLGGNSYGAASPNIRKILTKVCQTNVDIAKASGSYASSFGCGY